MSELPSRDDIAESLNFAPAQNNEDGDKLVAVAVAYAEGRLFDREAINYEAATLRAAMWWAKTDASQLPVGAASDIVNAALGIGGR